MRKIYIKEFASTDPRLKRHVHHDSKSKEFEFNTTGLSIIDVEHKRYIPILDQGQVGSCTGDAGIGDINTDPFVQMVNPHYSADQAGAYKLYSDAEVIDGNGSYPPNDYGSSGLSIAKALYAAGLISGYQHTFSLNTALKAGSKYPFITGIPWYEDMYNPDADGRVHITGKFVGGHEIESRQIDAKNERVWFDNSWTDKWGVKGRFYLTFKDFGTLLARQGDVTILFPPMITPPTPLNPTLRLGDKGNAVVRLQTELNTTMGAGLTADGSFGPQTKTVLMAFQATHGLTHDGICGLKTWDALNCVIQITKASLDTDVELELMLAVCSCEGGFYSKATNKNKNGSIDKGCFQWNDLAHAEISEAQAFDPYEAAVLFAKAIKANPHNLHAWWAASQHCWSQKLSPAIRMKYGI